MFAKLLWTKRNKRLQDMKLLENFIILQTSCLIRLLNTGWAASGLQNPFELFTFSQGY